MYDNTVEKSVSIVSISDFDDPYWEEEKEYYETEFKSTEGNIEAYSIVFSKDNYKIFPLYPLGHFQQ